MNKLLKGSIAGAVGVALLLGGAGTFASWNSTAIVGSAGAIKAGTLTVTDPAPATPGTWRNGPLTTSPTITIANFRTVPGDVLTYTKTLNVVATGDNLKAILSLDPNSITGTTTSIPDATLAGYLSNNATISATGTGVTTTSGVTNIATTATSIVVVVTLNFPNGAAGAENLAKSGSVDLSKVAVILTQN